MNKRIALIFILLFLPFVLGGSTFFDNPDDSFIMDNIVLPPPITPPSPGGGGGGVAPECTLDSECGLGESCFAGKCRVDECTSDADCNDTKTCWMNMCVKLFDMKILEVQSPIESGNTFEFTYYIKGVAAIHGDVIVRFWLVKDGEIVTDGFDTIYMADFDETTQTSELFLPSSIEDGVYNFYTEVAYDSYYARAGRMIEVGDGGILGELLDISFNLDSALIENSNQLSAGVDFDSFGEIPAKVNLTFTIIDSTGNEVYRGEDKITVATRQFFRWNYEGLNISEGEYTAILETAYGDDVVDRFTQKFTIEKKVGIINILLGNIILPLLILAAIVILVMIVYWERKKLKKVITKKERWLKKRRSLLAGFVFGIIIISIIYYLGKLNAVLEKILFILNSYCIYIVLLLLIILIISYHKKIGKYLKLLFTVKVRTKRKKAIVKKRRKNHKNFFLNLFKFKKKKSIKKKEHRKHKGFFTKLFAKRRKKKVIVKKVRNGKHKGIFAGLFKKKRRLVKKEVVSKSSFFNKLFPKGKLKASRQ